MTPERFREILRDMDWSLQDVIHVLQQHDQPQWNERDIRRWAKPGSEIPDEIGRWIEGLFAFHWEHIAGYQNEISRLNEVVATLEDDYLRANPPPARSRQG